MELSGVIFLSVTEWVRATLKTPQLEEDAERALTWVVGNYAEHGESTFDPRLCPASSPQPSDLTLSLCGLQSTRSGLRISTRLLCAIRRLQTGGGGSNAGTASTSDHSNFLSCIDSSDLSSCCIHARL